MASLSDDALIKKACDAGYKQKRVKKIIADLFSAELEYKNIDIILECLRVGGVDAYIKQTKKGGRNTPNVTKAPTQRNQQPKAPAQMTMSDRLKKVVEIKDLTEVMSGLVKWLSVQANSSDIQTLFDCGAFDRLVDRLVTEKFYGIEVFSLVRSFFQTLYGAPAGAKNHPFETVYTHITEMNKVSQDLSKKIENPKLVRQLQKSIVKHIVAEVKDCHALQNKTAEAQRNLRVTKQKLSVHYTRKHLDIPLGADLKAKFGFRDSICDAVQLYRDQHSFVNQLACTEEPNEAEELPKQSEATVAAIESLIPTVADLPGIESLNELEKLEEQMNSIKEGDNVRTKEFDEENVELDNAKSELVKQKEELMEQIRKLDAQIEEIESKQAVVNKKRDECVQDATNNLEELKEKYTSIYIMKPTILEIQKVVKSCSETAKEALSRASESHSQNEQQLKFAVPKARLQFYQSVLRYCDVEHVCLDTMAKRKVELERAVETQEKEIEHVEKMNLTKVVEGQKKEVERHKKELAECSQIVNTLHKTASNTWESVILVATAAMEVSQLSIQEVEILESLKKKFTMLDIEIDFEIPEGDAKIENVIGGEAEKKAAKMGLNSFLAPNPPFKKVPTTPTVNINKPGANTPIKHTKPTVVKSGGTPWGGKKSIEKPKVSLAEVQREQSGETVKKSNKQRKNASNNNKNKKNKKQQQQKQQKKELPKNEEEEVKESSTPMTPGTPNTEGGDAKPQREKRRRRGEKSESPVEATKEKTEEVIAEEH
eukprot:TRINITY_DN97_c0_g3_i7.p1 TRINITY_DN97_c0_g3~~TRINITY_DN97_c0_g3_i7.p1  ORF type:complete len:769 (+),score=301.56 TRINITY_DN97_c0_g3_i7:85-2391(+)